MKFRIWMLPIILILLFSGVVEAIWRPGEMRVKLENVTAEDLPRIAAAGIEVDDVRLPVLYLYVIPQELARLEQFGLQPEVIIPDMAAYSRRLLESPTLIGYHDYRSSHALVDSLALAFPDIIRKVVYGHSAQGRELFAVKLSDNVQEDEAEPEIGFDGCHHGDEIVSAEILIRTLRDFCLSYGRDKRITRLINRREIWFFPLVNPDGRQALTRRNSNYVDLNRDWGYMWDGWGNSSAPYSQPETRAVLQWILQNQFVINQSVHAGMELISFPWSYQPALTPDNSIVEHLAELYLAVSRYSNLTYGNGYTRLYPIKGSAKDSYYGLNGSLSWTMEVSSNKAPPAADVKGLYRRHLAAMAALLESAGQGVRGIVSDAQTGEPLRASVWVIDKSSEYWPVYSDPEIGDFHKILLPGRYAVKISANGYRSVLLNSVTVSDTGATFLEVSLAPQPGSYAQRVLACGIPGKSYVDEGLTYRALAEPDRRYFSLGRSGWIILDMGSIIRDLPGSDLRVIEGSMSAEGFSLEVACHWAGPWMQLGSGRGTSDFDLATHNIPRFRYVRIQDDGDGFSGIARAGFDLDALESHPLPENARYLFEATHRRLFLRTEGQ